MPDDYGQVETLMGNGSETTNEGGVTTEATEDEPIENRYNDIEGYWTPMEEERKFSSDTPDVRIYISREIVADSVEGEEGSEGDGTVVEVDEAIKISRDLAKLYESNKDINNSNTSIINSNGEQIIAMNAIDKINFNDVPK